jgi:hypothetical protein
VKTKRDWDWKSREIRRRVEMEGMTLEQSFDLEVDQRRKLRQDARDKANLVARDHWLAAAEDPGYRRHVATNPPRSPSGARTVNAAGLMAAQKRLMEALG